MNQTNELHDRPRRLTGGTLYAVRSVRRPLTAGDRVKDLFHAPFRPNANQANYPGAHAYGTIIAGPKFFGSALLAQVRFDDGFEGWLLTTDLERI